MAQLAQRVHVVQRRPEAASRRPPGPEAQKARTMAEPQAQRGGAVAERVALPVSQAVGARRREEATGLPPRLRGGIEALSGLAMDDVRVHRDSAEPARLGALAFTRGSEIHLGPGQDRHLAHEAWHVVQQKQGRVKATAQLKSVAVNDDAGLEAEADRMGERAAAADRRDARPSAAPRAAGGVVQAKLKSGTTWLTAARGHSAIALDYIARSEQYLLRSNSRPHHKAIHVVDMSKKYLLGEIHDSGKWKKDVAGWKVDRMKEEEKAIPAEAGDTAGHFRTAPSRLEQPLESAHAYMLTKLLRAHDHLNVLGWHFRTFKEGGHRDWPPWTDAALDELDQVIVVFHMDYAPFITTYNKTYLPSLPVKVGPWGTRWRTPSPRLAKIHDFAAGLRSHSASLGKLIAALKEVRRLGKARRAPTTANFEAQANEVETNRMFLPASAKQLIAITSEADPAEARQIEALTTVSDDFRGAEISAKVDPVRERAMAANISAAAAPLLVQIGNAHIHRVAGLVGASAVPVDKATKFSDVTRRR